MPTSQTYDPSNIFAKILRGEIPCHKVYEDADAIAFMDVMPQSPGHTLIVPKAPSRNVLDANPNVLAKILPLVQKSLLLQKLHSMPMAFRLCNSTNQRAGRRYSTCTITSCRASTANLSKRIPAKWKTARCLARTPKK